jgi:RNA polymerase sigma-70 factor, ECF subfamily
MPCPTISADRSDAVLLERAGRGDVHAYEQLYRRFRRPAQALAHRVCGRRCVAEEVVQEAFLAVWRHAHTYEESRGSARGWILAIVRNRALDESRRRRPTECGEAMLDAIEDRCLGPVPTETEVERRERRHAVHGALRLLPPAQCEAVVLAHYGGLSNRETAAALGRSLGTVKGRIRLAHARLRQDLAGVVAAPS